MHQKVTKRFFAEKVLKVAKIEAWSLLKKTTGTRKPRGYWLLGENRRKCFTEFAQEMGFDPLDIHGWNKITQAQFEAKKVTAC